MNELDREIAELAAMLEVDPRDQEILPLPDPESVTQIVKELQQEGMRS